jgi:hypothetical protein
MLKSRQLHLHILYYISSDIIVVLNSKLCSFEDMPLDSSVSSANTMLTLKRVDQKTDSSTSPCMSVSVACRIRAGGGAMPV